MADVFVSYSRRDQAFVRRLHEALVAAGREVWVDWEGIPPSAKWMDEVKAAIDAADAFVFVVSPDSAASPVCRDEAEHAVAVGKRIVPIVWRDTPEHDLPAAISAHNWLTLREADDFDAGFAKLLAALDTDLEWVKEHTRLVTRAREWEASGGERSRLLRGRDLERAEQAIARAERDPRPTPLQTSYVLASRQAERRGARLRTALLSGGLVVALVLAGFALLQRNAAEQNATLADQQRQVAEEQRGEAQTQRSAAEQQATLAQARELTAAAGRELAADPELSVLLAREAVDLVQDPDTDHALREALQASRMRARYEDCPGGDVRGLDLSRDGSRVAGGTLDGYVCVWDRSTQQLITSVQVPGSAVGTVAIHPDGSMVAAASSDGAVAVWSADDGQRLARWRAHDGDGLDVAFSPDGRWLATAGLDGLARVWTVGDWTLARTIPAVADDVMNSVRFAPDGTRLITTNADLTTRVWDVATGDELARYVGPTRMAFVAALSPDGAFVAAGAQEETARIWDAGSGTQLHSLIHSGEVYDVAFAPDGSHLATASADGFVRIWDVGTGELLEQLAGHDGSVNQVMWSPDGTTVLTSGRDGTVREWAASGAERLTTYEGHFGSVSDGDVTADGTRVLTAGAGDSTALVHDATTGEVLATLSGHDNAIAAGMFSRDGDKVFTASLDGTARLWDAATGDVLMRFESAGDRFNGGALSPDASLVVAGGDNDTVLAWDASGEQAWTAPMENDVVSVAFAPDGETVYVADVTGLVLAIARDGTERFRLHTGDAGVTALATNPDGTRLAVLGRDARVRVYDVATREVVLDVPPASGYGWHVAYSPDGTRVATGGDDGAVHVFDAATGERLADLRADTRDAFLGKFLDEERIFTTTRTNQSMLLRCDLCGDTGSVRALADTRATRAFTTDERVALLHEPAAAPSPGSQPEQPAPAASAEPLPPPSVAPGGAPCTWVTGPCEIADTRYRTSTFALLSGLDVPGADLLFGENPTLMGFGLSTGDQFTLGDARSFTASDGRSLVPIRDTIEDIEAFFRSRPWMRVSRAKDLVVDGHRARMFQITSDSTQELPYGALAGAAFFWATGETLDVAVVDGPRGRVIAFGDRISDMPQAEFDAQFEAAIRSIRFREP